MRADGQSFPLAISSSHRRSSASIPRIAELVRCCQWSKNLWKFLLCQELKLQTLEWQSCTNQYTIPLHAHLVITSRTHNFVLPIKDDKNFVARYAYATLKTHRRELL